MKKVLILTLLLLFSIESFARPRYCEGLASRELKELGYGSFDSPTVNKRKEHGIDAYSFGRGTSARDVQVFAQVSGTSYIHVMIDRHGKATRKSLKLNSSCEVEEVLIGEGLGQLKLNRQACDRVEALFLRSGCPSDDELRNESRELTSKNFSSAVLNCAKYRSDFSFEAIPPANYTATQSPPGSTQSAR